MPSLENILPFHLSERTRCISHAGADSKGFVLYWMRTAMRAHENPCLDAAMHYAKAKGRQLLIYQGLDERYAYASDRHHLFILQGARDVQRECKTRGLSYVFHLARKKERSPRLLELAELSCVIFTEDMPTRPASSFLEALKKKTSTPIFAVDTACVVPMQCFGKAFTRAFAYRKRAATEYESRVSAAYDEVDFDVLKGSAPFESLDLEHADLNALLKECAIDHSVPPVNDTQGGSSAGYARFDAFKENALKYYARKRNDPLSGPEGSQSLIGQSDAQRSHPAGSQSLIGQSDAKRSHGVSRMSAYLHYGMVSPFKLAREADAQKSEGAKKYLDELLIWRELSYRFCFYNDDHHAFDALPEWALDTLAEHDEAREQEYSVDDLMRAKTSSALFNAAQMSLLRQGELHNNVRMTWGKAFLTWASPRRAFELAVDFNHRFALDGRDPSSYGGLLWCFGQFDRPFEKSRYFGSVRGRSISAHESRLDVETYAKATMTPRRTTPRIAVVGAGVAGSFCARTLFDQGLDVTLFDKSKRTGGRMSTRPIDGHVFDHGAQYFRARDPRFKMVVQRLLEQGCLADFAANESIAIYDKGVRQENAKREKRFVAQPSMRGVCEYWCEDLKVLKHQKVTSVERVGEKYHLVVGSDVHEFERVIIATPTEQIVGMLKGFDDLKASLNKVEMNPTLALMLSLKSKCADWRGAFLNDEVLSWAARREHCGAESLVLHASQSYSRQHLGDDASISIEKMKKAFEKATGIALDVKNEVLHRWRYAFTETPLGDDYLSNEDESLFCCGDWALGARIEAAYLSGAAAAGALLRSL